MGETMDYKKFQTSDAELKKELMDHERRNKFRKDFEKVGGVYKAWKEVLPILKDVAVEHHNKHMDQAEKLYEKVYLKIRDTTSIKGALSKSEIKAVLKQKDHIGNFASRMVQAEKILGRANDYINKGTKLCNIATGLYAMYVGHTYRITYKDNLSKAARIREEVRYGQQQMMHVTQITAEVASFAPPGIKEYLEFNMKAFQACGKAFDRVYKYAKKIEDLSKEVFAALGDSIGDRSKSIRTGDSLLFDDKYKKMHKNHNAGAQLDIVGG